MRNIKKLLKESYRVIEFSSRKSIFSMGFSKGDNLLTILKKKNNFGDKTIFLEGEDFTNAIIKNSTDVIIINNAGWVELKALQKTIGPVFFLERITVFNIIFLYYFLLKEIFTGRKKYHGLFYFRTRLKISLYLGLKNKRQRERITRHYFSPLISIEDFFKELNSKKINYCILRWFEELPKIEPGEDIDVLVGDNDLPKIYSVLDQRPGIVPFDIYSKSGMPGSDFSGLPYYIFELAGKVLSDTVLYKSSFKVPTWENYFYLLAYHSVFHKGEASGLTSNKYNLTSKVKPDHDYLYHLKVILSKTDLDVKELTLEGLHSFLNLKGYVPPLDTLYKLSLRNQYLKAFLEDYHNQSDIPKTFEGLVCFVVREKIVKVGLVEYLKKLIQKHGFTIILSSQIEDSVKDDFAKQVRGGNWNQGPWPTNAGKPALLIVAFDVYPIKPTPEDLQKHPGLSNKRIEEKNEIRDVLNMKLPDKKDWCNGLHSSDNEIQAIEYLSLAGLNKEEIYREIRKYKELFETKHPVIEVLSGYSRRAKVELISYNGGKAVKKTFKPKCEQFLANEIEAYTQFKELVEVPQLLEAGENYIITSYIDGAKSLGSMVSFKTLTKCLNSLHKVYDKGYSFIDFQPTTFLMDKKKNLYMIDFEFLHKYSDKPSFIGCYDLVGTPDSFDILYTPNNKVPKGMTQFDIRWSQFTGVSYEDILKLSNIGTRVKSSSRYYILKIKKVLQFVRSDCKRALRLILRILP